MSTDPVRLMLVESEPDHLILFSAILETDPRMIVVAQAEDGAHTLSQLAAMPVEALPHVIITDNHLPGEMTGLEMAEHVLRTRPAFLIILFPAYISPAIRA